jgi:hypothetical protein
MGKGAKGGDNKDMPTSGLEFCVIFTFKAVETQKPKPPVRRPAPAARSS